MHGVCPKFSILIHFVESFKNIFAANILPQHLKLSCCFCGRCRGQAGRARAGAGAGTSVFCSVDCFEARSCIGISKKTT